MGGIRKGHEATPRALVRAHLSRGARVLEVGAGIGGVTSEMVGVAEFVVACEPQPKVHEELVGNVPEALALPLAVTPNGARIALYAGRNWYETQAQAPEPRATEKFAMMALSVPINRVLRPLAIDALVMDCEGMEAALLKAADLTGLSTICVEHHPAKRSPKAHNEAMFRVAEAGFSMVARERAHPEEGLDYEVWQRS